MKNVELEVFEVEKDTPGASVRVKSDPDGHWKYIIQARRFWMGFLPYWHTVGKTDHDDSLEGHIKKAARGFNTRYFAAAPKRSSDE